MTKDLIQSIAKATGIQIAAYQAVQGGNINAAWQVQAGQHTYFLKLNDAALYPAMFSLEAAGLTALRNTQSVAVPETIQQGLYAGQQWLLLEWIKKGPPSRKSMENFGMALANVHKQPQKYFGWHADNYIGSLLQLNTKQTGWSAFYSECRIMPLLKILYQQQGFTKRDVDSAERFCAALDDIFPAEPPSLLHGDCWAGNYLINEQGTAVLFDPAVYNGHREMDIGMTKLFGGFDGHFYNGYQNVFPLETGWQQRLPYSQLYPLLVHAVLFGGHYAASAREILSRF